IGLGSGILSTELLFKFRRLKMIASEWDPDAARIGEENCARILQEKTARSMRLEVVRPRTKQEVMEPFTGVSSSLADFLISNPP
ncbi:hypothetical protein ACI3PL_27465, partial [Lacticaseibacillus paracasei]